MAKFPGQSEVIASIRAATLVHFQLSKDDPTGTYSIPVPAGTFVHEVATNVAEVCDGTPTLTAGDTSDVDGYLTSAQIAPGTAGSVTTPEVIRASSVANPYRYGKYYAVAGTVDFIWTKGTSPTTGQIKGFVQMSNVKLDGIAAGLTT